MTEEQVIAGRYQLVRRIGSGGMGVVWQAYDERLHRKVAVKQLLMSGELTGPQTAEALRRVMREGRIAAKLQHPQVIAVYDVVEDDGLPFLIMEYVPSRSLAEVLAQDGPLPREDVARIGAHLAATLAVAHGAGVVHRDIKPGNVLLGPDGTAKITDFGISRAVEDVTATATGLIAGTPAFLSPEVAQGLPATAPSQPPAEAITMFDGDQRRVRLIYSLLFSQPDTPVVFYGEEIGMVEDLRAEGRLAVRTPMEWTSGANAQAQRRDPDSLLSWFKLLLERYRECPELAWGDHEILDAGEPSVLVQRSDIDAGAVIAVHNLADTPVEARLVLDGMDGSYVLNDLLANDKTEVQDGGKVTLALAPYGTRWLRARSG